MASQLAAQEEDDVEEIKAQSRLRRQAILAKYKQQSQESPVERRTEPADMFSGSSVLNLRPLVCLFVRLPQLVSCGLSSPYFFYDHAPELQSVLTPVNTSADAQTKPDGGQTSSSLRSNDVEMIQVEEKVNGGLVAGDIHTVESGDQPCNAGWTLGKLSSANGACDRDSTVVSGGLGGGSPKVSSASFGSAVGLICQSICAVWTCNRFRVKRSPVSNLFSFSLQSEQSTDMFCDDIFGESPAGGRRMVRI